jgi:hypothetical protein
LDRCGAALAGAKADEMKWMLVVRAGGLSPVNTALVFDKFTDCLAAEKQMRKKLRRCFRRQEAMGCHQY